MKFEVNKRYLVIRAFQKIFHSPIELRVMEISPSGSFAKFQSEESWLWEDVNNYEILEELPDKID